MTEPTVAFVLTTSPTVEASYAGTASTASVVRPVQVLTRDLSHETDPLMAWLASDEARGHEGHWVALDPDTGEFLGRADTRAELRHWREHDVSILFVEPRRRRAR